MIKNLLGDDEPAPETESKPTARTSNNSVLSLFDSADGQTPTTGGGVVISPTKDEDDEPRIPPVSDKIAVLQTVPTNNLEVARYGQ